MIKTIALVANTEKTQAVDNKYMLVKNLGATTVYVSQKATIVAESDEVQSIAPLTSEVVKDINLANGTANVYFLCSESNKIEIQTSADANFKKYLKGGEFGKSFAEEKIITLTLLKALNASGTWANNVYVSNGITWTCTVDGDEVKSINVNGTATAVSTLNLKIRTNEAVLLDTTKKYVLQGCPDGGSVSTYYLRLQIYRDLAGTFDSNQDDIGSGKIFTSNYVFYNCFVRVASGVTVSNKVFTPKLLLDSCYI